MLAICFRLPLTERRRSDCLLFTLLLDGQMILWQYITQIIALSLFTRRHLWHVQPITLDMDSMRGHCSDRSVLGRQSSLVASRADCVLFILRIPLSPKPFTDVRGGVAMWKSVKHSFLPRCMQCRRGIAMRILSVRPSVCHTRVLWQNGRKICPDFYTIRTNI